MRLLFLIIVVTLITGVSGSASAKPAGSCSPWPECKGGDDGSGSALAFSENCKNLNQWTVSGSWSVSRGECLAKNTGTPHFMVTATNIDLSGALEAYLSYKYRIENADPGESMVISVSSNGGDSFIPVETYVGSRSGTVSLNLANYLGMDLPSAVRLRAGCLVDANNEICAWDNIKIEIVANPPKELLVTIDSPQARTFGSADFPLTYEVSLSHEGTVDYILDDNDSVMMTADEGSSGTVHTIVEESLSNGIYTFQALAKDEMGNVNNTQSVVFTVDDSAPTIAFVDPTPADGSSLDSSDISVSLSTGSGSDHYSFVDFDRDLYLWLRMEDVVGNAVSDSSSYGNDGVVEGDAFQNPKGRFGSAFEFDGINHGGDVPTDRILIPGFQEQYPIFNSSFTAMAWAKPDISEKMVIIGTKSITNLPGWHLRTSGGNHRLRMGVNTGYTNATSATAETHNPMVAGEWVHVVGVYDSTVPSILLYLDGELVDTTVEGVSSTGYGNTLELAIAVPEDPQKAWDGQVDEVLIFDRVLGANEIKALYDSTADQFYNTYLGLDSGVHQFIGYSVNAGGNSDQTEVRNVTIN